MAGELVVAESRALFDQDYARAAPDQRRDFLERVERSPLLVVRRGFWGIRTLVFMGYYARADVAGAIGYRASADGWEGRGGTVSTVPLAPMLWVEP